ncbi:MAG: tetratricopeptide repeat protein [Bryobacterales bacterium]
MAHFNLGNVCEETVGMDEAIERYEQALQLNPSYADAHYNLALVYERRREPMRAARHWRHYLKLDPGSPWAGIARRQLKGLLQVTPGGAK